MKIQQQIQQPKIKFNQFDINKDTPIPLNSRKQDPRRMPLISDLIALYGEEDIKQLINI